MAGADDVVALEPGVAERLRTVFTRHEDAVGSARGDLAQVVGFLDDGAGEFSGVMSHASGSFGASWEEATARAALSAGVIAATATQFSADLAEVDASAADD